jgi:hypothetical protein
MVAGSLPGRLAAQGAQEKRLNHEEHEEHEEELFGSPLLFVSFVFFVVQSSDPLPTPLNA